jgi:hypothetical protein
MADPAKVECVRELHSSTGAVTVERVTLHLPLMLDVVTAVAVALAPFGFEIRWEDEPDA